MAFPEGPLVSPLFSSHTVDSVHDKLIRSLQARRGSLGLETCEEAFLRTLYYE